MVEYHPFMLGLSAHQLRRLASGQAVRLKHSDVVAAEGGVPVCVTKTQLNRLRKAAESGKGLQLTFSAAQIEACQQDKMGGGFFTDSLKKIGSTAKAIASNPIAHQLAATIADRYGAQGIDAATGLAQGAMNGSSRIPDAAKPFLEAGLNLGAKLTKSQLEALVKGIKKGSGLYAPGHA